MLFYSLTCYYKFIIPNLSLQAFSGSKSHEVITSYLEKYFSLHTIHTQGALEYS